MKPALDFTDYFKRATRAYLGREWKATDGLPATAVTRAEKRLRSPLPTAIEAFYRALGKNREICAVHNYIFGPHELTWDGDYLIFMDENQSVVSWGIRRADLKLPDPPTYQRNNTPPVAWFAEDKTFTELLRSMFDWYAEEQIW